ncbi:DoxX family protein [Chryseobacterium sp. ISL-6]|uniref:DoxX family protein n=1 Tax=Chryseobacterium sp. ISL-6 TaxID=2819143 RepID=UPI001BEB57CB|nr:DoxX family protein [Chryseobacterium sp. ISL-6]MBT2622799.1 DoxX family protein [Chryseobacterium sp. ISL-6]
MKASKILNISLWTVQIFLSTSLIWASSMKLFQPIDELSKMWPWTAANRGLVIITGIFDATAAIGLVFPNLINPKTRFTIYAAYGVILLMISASIFHISRGEISQIGINIFFLLISIYIVWGKNKQLGKLNSIDKIN